MSVFALTSLGLILRDKLSLLAEVWLVPFSGTQDLGDKKGSIIYWEKDKSYH